MTPEVAGPPNVLGPHTSLFLANTIQSRNVLPNHRLLAHVNTQMASLCEAFWFLPTSKPLSQEKILSLSIFIHTPIKHYHIVL